MFFLPPWQKYICDNLEGLIPMQNFQITGIQPKNGRQYPCQCSCPIALSIPCFVTHIEGYPNLHVSVPSTFPINSHLLAIPAGLRLLIPVMWSNLGKTVLRKMVTCLGLQGPRALVWSTMEEGRWPWLWVSISTWPHVCILCPLRRTMTQGRPEWNLCGLQ